MQCMNHLRVTINMCDGVTMREHPPAPSQAGADEDVEVWTPSLCKRGCLLLSAVPMPACLDLQLVVCYCAAVADPAYRLLALPGRCCLGEALYPDMSGPTRCSCCCGLPGGPSSRMWPSSQNAESMAACTRGSGPCPSGNMSNVTRSGRSSSSASMLSLLHMQHT